MLPAYLNFVSFPSARGHDLSQYVACYAYSNYAIMSYYIYYIVFSEGYRIENASLQIKNIRSGNE